MLNLFKSQSNTINVRKLILVAKRTFIHQFDPEPGEWDEPFEPTDFESQIRIKNENFISELIGASIVSCILIKKGILKDVEQVDSSENKEVMSYLLEVAERYLDPKIAYLRVYPEKSRNVFWLSLQVEIKEMCYDIQKLMEKLLDDYNYYPSIGYYLVKEIVNDSSDNHVWFKRYELSDLISDEKVNEAFKDLSFRVMNAYRMAEKEIR